MAFTLKNRIILFVLMVVAYILFGAMGYLGIRIYIEHHTATLTDAIYFSIATISTLGYYPPGTTLTSEVGKWFHIAYLTIGLGVIFGGIQTVVGPWLELKIKRAEKGWRKPLPKDEHIIICGYNELSRYITTKLSLLKIPFVVIDKNPPDNLPHIEGVCTEIEALKKANLSRASSLIALMDDRQNAIIALTARGLNEDLNIITLAENEHSVEILKNSGADSVVSKDQLLGGTIKLWASGDFKYDIFASAKRLPMGEKKVKGAMAGKKIADLKFREKYGTILAVHRSGRVIPDPGPGFTLKSGDTIIYVPNEGGAS